MQLKILLLITLMLGSVQLISAQIATGGGYSLQKSVIAGGGGSSSGAGFALTGTVGQTAARPSVSAAQFSHPIGFWVPEMAPTASSVSVSGRVLMAEGAGIRNAVVTLTDASGLSRTTLTGSLGRFEFTDVEVGQVYVISVQSKRFRFSAPSRIISVDDQVVGLDFLADGP